MPWLHTEKYPLPEEDLVSFSFGNLHYDPDKPVRNLHCGQDTPEC